MRIGIAKKDIREGELIDVEVCGLKIKSKQIKFDKNPENALRFFNHDFNFKGTILTVSNECR